MKNNLFTALVLLIMAGCLFSQDKSQVHYEAPDMSKWIGSEIGNPNSPETVIPKTEQSTEVKKLLAEQRQAKLEANTSKVMQIQQQLDQVTGASTTMKPAPYNGGYRYVGEPVPNGQMNVTNNRVFATWANSSTRGVCTYTQQRGVNNGRVWVFVGYGGAVGPDSVRAFYSDDNGTSWIFHSLYWLGNSDKIRADEMDLEVIEKDSGDKYMWLVYGINASNGKKLSGMIIIQQPSTFLVGMWAFAWPGENFGVFSYFTYRPRVTSDNANFYTSNNSWIFVAASFDSLNTSQNNHRNAQKICVCQNPYTTSPTFNYKSTQAYWNCSDASGSDVHTDIQYYRNTSDSLIVTWTNSSCDPNKIYTTKFDENPDINVPGPGPTLDLGAPTYAKNFARIAGNGGAELMIVCRQNWLNNGDWDIVYAKSTNGGNAWTSALIDTRTDITNYPKQPEIFGKKTPTTGGIYKMAYYVNGYDSVYSMYYPLVGSTYGWSTYKAVNFVPSSSSLGCAKPTFTNFQNDSCVVFYPETGPVNLWAARGCTGAIMTGINNYNGQIPAEYKLAQNYPNPFNPSTNIKFNIPRQANVKLTVFDITGQEVATLVNGNLEAGIHEVTFDASSVASGVYFYKLEGDGFSDVRKMMLIK